MKTRIVRGNTPVLSDYTVDQKKATRTFDLSEIANITETEAAEFKAWKDVKRDKRYWGHKIEHDTHEMRKSLMDTWARYRRHFGLRTYDCGFDPNTHLHDISYRTEEQQKPTELETDVRIATYPPGPWPRACRPRRQPKATATANRNNTTQQRPRHRVPSQAWVSWCRPTSASRTAPWAAAGRWSANWKQVCRSRPDTPQL